MANCPCGSNQTYEQCCEPFIKGIKIASTPEELLRARYTAHVKCEVDFIVSTVAPEKREAHDVNGIKKWASESTWDGLEILKVGSVTPESTEGTVEFVANYREKLKKIRHHEIAHFKKIEGKWYFDDSEVPFQQVVNDEPKVGRNDPCPCGSGKKYKKCCGD